MLPNFLIIGAMKAGTTSLYHYLRHHPDVFMADPKELDFFVARANWGRGLGWYRQHFAGAGPAAAVGEASPNYSKRHDDPDVAGRVAASLPGARLVYLVRHPVERMLSMYRQVAADGLESRTAAEAFAADPDYLRTSMYAWQLEPYLEHFPAERILVMTSERLRADRAAAVARVFDFLGVDPAWQPPKLERESQRGDRLRVPRSGLTARLGDLPGYRNLLERSWRLRELHGRLTTRPAPPVDARLPADQRAELEAALAPDVARLYPLVDGPFDGWGIA